MRTRATVDWTACSLALALSMFSQACLDEDPTELSGARDAETGVPPSALQEDLGESPLMMNLAREIPGFAGIFFEPGGERLVISLTESNQTEFAEVQQAVLAGLAADVVSPPAAHVITPPQFVRRVVEYSFIELAWHRARLRSPLFAIPEVVSLSVDEEFNRIKIGLEDPAARGSVLALAAELAVPAEMLSFAEESRPVLLHMSAGKPRLPSSSVDSLHHRIADGRLRGGYAVRVEEKDTAVCTLGFPAILRNRSAKRVFVTSSHCSTVRFDLDARDVGQPDTSNVVGYEIKDPEPHSCRTITDWRRKCRHSDAALNRATADIALGEIGRTKDRVNCGDGCYLKRNTEIQSTRPTISITGYARSIIDNEILHKVGQATGWTYGDVTETCKDMKLDEGEEKDPRIVRLCSGVGHIGVYGGDSGAPVFRYKRSDLTVELKGIVWVGEEGGTNTYFSNYERIERDLGGMWVYDPGPPVIRYITGPPWVPRGWECGWNSSSDGMYPFHHYWSGVLTGFTGERHGILGSPEESGWLKLEVVDILGRRVQDSVYVIVLDHIVPPVGCWPPTR